MKPVITSMARGHIDLSVDGRCVRIPGEAFFRGFGSPDFLAYPSDVVQWEDGERLTNEVRERILIALSEAAKAANITIEFEPYSSLP